MKNFLEIIDRSNRRDDGQNEMEQSLQFIYFFSWNYNFTLYLISLLAEDPISVICYYSKSPLPYLLFWQNDPFCKLYGF